MNASRCVFVFVIILIFSTCSFALDTPKVLDMQFYMVAERSLQSAYDFGIVPSFLEGLGEMRFGEYVPHNTVFYQAELEFNKYNPGYICAAIAFSPINNDSKFDVVWSQKDKKRDMARSYKMGKLKSKAQQFIDCKDIHNMPGIIGDWTVDVNYEESKLYAKSFEIRDIKEHLKQFVTIDANILKPEEMPEGTPSDRINMLTKYTVVPIKYSGSIRLSDTPYLPNIDIEDADFPYVYGATDSYLLINNTDKIANLLKDDTFSFAFPEITKAMGENNFTIHDKEYKNAMLYFPKLDIIPETLDLVIPINYCGRDCNIDSLKTNYVVRLIENKKDDGK